MLHPGVVPKKRNAVQTSHQSPMTMFSGGQAEGQSVLETIELQARTQMAEQKLNKRVLRRQY